MESAQRWLLQRQYIRPRSQQEPLALLPARRLPPANPRFSTSSYLLCDQVCSSCIEYNVIVCHCLAARHVLFVTALYSVDQFDSFSKLKRLTLLTIGVARNLFWTICGCFLPSVHASYPSFSVLYKATSQIQQVGLWSAVSTQSRV